MTIRQIQWAMQHDWYYYTGTNSVTGEDIVHVRCDMVEGRILDFTNFKELKEWAGY